MTLPALGVLGTADTLLYRSCCQQSRLSTEGKRLARISHGQCALKSSPLLDPHSDRRCAHSEVLCRLLNRDQHPVVFAALAVEVDISCPSSAFDAKPANAPPSRSCPTRSRLTPSRRADSAVVVSTVEGSAITRASQAVESSTTKSLW